MACAALGGEAEYCHTRLYAGYVAGGLCGRYCDLCELFGCGVGDYGAVGKDEYAVGAEVKSVGEQHEEGSRNDADAGLCLDHLECGAEYVAGGVLCACHLSVGVAGFHHQAAEI